MEVSKICPICGTGMVKQIVEDSTTKQFVQENICFKCGCATPYLEEGDDTYVQDEV